VSPDLQELELGYSVDNTIFAEHALLFGQLRLAAMLNDVPLRVSRGVRRSITALTDVDVIKRPLSGA
jgi:hypothetical protein